MVWRVWRVGVSFSQATQATVTRSEIHHARGGVPIQYVRVNNSVITATNVRVYVLVRAYAGQ